MTSLRCSELDRILACPGSLTLCALVDKRISDEGTEGTALHHDAATRIVSELGGSAPDGLPPHDPSWPSLRFSKWISDYYVRHVRDNVPAGWSLEVEVPLSYEFNGFILSGHIDCVAVSPDCTEAMGWDLKTGHDPVDEAEQNWQMAGYSLLIKKAYPDVTSIIFYVVQPRNDEDEGFQRVSHLMLSTWLYVDNMCAGLVKRIQAALAAPMSLDTGRKQCRFCSAKLQCPATISQRELMKMTMTKEQLAQIKSVPDDATLADWIMAGRVVGPVVDDAEKLAKERIAAVGGIVSTDGTRITIKTSNGSYSVEDKAALWAVVKDLLPEERMAACVKWSMVEIKDQVAAHMNVPKSGRGITSESIFDAKVRPLVTQKTKQTFQFQ